MLDPICYLLYIRVVIDKYRTIFKISSAFLASFPINLALFLPITKSFIMKRSQASLWWTRWSIFCVLFIYSSDPIGHALLTTLTNIVSFKKLRQSVDIFTFSYYMYITKHTFQVWNLDIAIYFGHVLFLHLFDDYHVFMNVFAKQTKKLVKWVLSKALM